MELSYTDILTGKNKRTKARITTDHPASSYGQPVVVLPDGGALDGQSWVLLGYQVVKISKTEAPKMHKWIENLNAMIGGSIGEKEQNKTVTIMLRNVPEPLRRAVKAKTAAEGKSMQAAIIELMRRWVEEK